MSPRKIFLLFAALTLLGAGITGVFSPLASLAWLPALLVVAVGVYDMSQPRHAIRRNFPVVGHFRYMLEGIGPELRQYFVESN